MSETVELNKPVFEVDIDYGGMLADNAACVVKVTYKLGAFNYIRKRKEFIMRVDGWNRVERAEKYCEKLNEAEKEMCDNDS